MAEYYGVKRTSHLQHWSPRTGMTWKIHKYIARLKTASGYRYIYTQAQLAAAKAGRAIGTTQRSSMQRANQNLRLAQNNNRTLHRIERDKMGVAQMRSARNTANRATSEYQRTILGRIEKAINGIMRGKPVLLPSKKKNTSSAASGGSGSISESKDTRSLREKWEERRNVLGGDSKSGKGGSGKGGGKGGKGKGGSGKGGGKGGSGSSGGKNGKITLLSAGARTYRGESSDESVGVQGKEDKKKKTKKKSARNPSRASNATRFSMKITNRIGRR